MNCLYSSSKVHVLRGSKVALDVSRCMSSIFRDKAYINGQWVSASSGKTFQVKNPVNGTVIATVPDMNAQDTKEAILSAHTAFASWKETTAKERSNLLRKWFNAMIDNQEELAKILTAEEGKPLAEARGEIAYSAGFFDWFSEESRRIYGEVMSGVATNKQMVFIREPIGVAAMITPWNFPSAMITRKVGAALAAGCTCVIKPAEDTPLSALALVALAEEIGIPPGVVNIVTSNFENSSEIGKVLCESPLVGALSFTGSTRVGKILFQQCASTVKKVSLELGGNAPFIVFDSADVDTAVAGCMASKFRNMGQTCVTSNRIFVQEGIFDKFMAKLQSAVEKTLVLGDGMDQGVNQGPLINSKQFERVVHMVNDATSKGATLVLGGEKHPVGDLFYRPTILTNLKENMLAFQEEIFGPVVSVIKFKTEEEALEMANNTRVGLAGYFFSNDVKQCWRVAKKLEVGMIGVNEGIISAPEAAFGGIKESGLGREGSRHGIDEYTDVKYICFGNL